MFISSTTKKYTNESMAFSSSRLAKNCGVAELQFGVGKHPLCENTPVLSSYLFILLFLKQRRKLLPVCGNWQLQEKKKS